ncbi:hypothetical protein [Pseudoduganella sp.]|uniref:hypothetical protein n=1 Tax=Pseudoduganella sp. TaxID=1880898 RepID=UPI0035B0A3D1
MGTMVWGLLGRESLGSVRRVRTLGLGAAVRNFNELAVPGLGGVWFARQVFLATLGVAVNELARQAGSRTSNIQVANALEAFGCWHALDRSGRARDERIKGSDTLPQVLEDFSFANISRPSFYITQPMRMQSVQALLELGLVTSKGQRFNSYAMTPAGRAFLDAAFRELPLPYGAAHLTALQQWVCGHERKLNSTATCKLLSPVEPLPLPAREQLRHLLVNGVGEEATRRRNLLEWMEDLRHGRVKPDEQPRQLSATHWHDVQAGRLFFALQAAAYALLETIEALLAQLTPHEIAPSSLTQAPVHSALENLRNAAAAYLEHGYEDKAGTGAGTFAGACTDTSDARLIEKLVSLDERVLRMRDGRIVPGAAFSADARLANREAAEEEGLPAKAPLVPAGVSYRINNLYLLNLDLNGVLDAALASEGEQRNG